MTITLLASSPMEYTYLKAEQKKLGKYPKVRICNKKGIIPKGNRWQYDTNSRI